MKVKHIGAEPTSADVPSAEKPKYWAQMEWESWYSIR